ncbi:helix-turn-helix domain-containing protein [Streptomyces sp. NPDC127038]|uniref:AraC-like ligand-binding domain-containing protein n=1 Tax=Streptomyces sp. NPDC127038 TaxID=3347114 RepID=UPI00365349E4
MIGTLIHTHDVPMADRFAYWCELVGRTRSPHDVSSVHATDFQAELRQMDMGPLNVWPTSFRPSRFRRSSRHVRRSDPETYHLTLLLEGGLGLDHADRNTVHGPGDLHVVDSSRPYDLRSADDGRSQAVSGVGADFPKALLPVPPHRMRALLGRPLSCREGTGALLSDFLVGLGRRAETLRPSDASRLGAVVLDLVSALFAQELETEDALSPETRQHALVEGIRAFIRQNLHDPELAPPMIAAAHHISLSYLHRIFQQHRHSETVAACIRRQRLEGARRDLARPALHGTPIHAVAVRWGLPRASDFTRAFRAAYGLSPREYRLQALSAPAEKPEPAPAR